jgi:predicted transporter
LWEITSWRMGVKFLMAVILFFLVNMIGDYLRIFFIENYGERFLKVVRKTFRFLLTNFFRTLSLYYFLSVILAMAILVYLGLTKVMNAMPQTGLFIFLIFLTQQIFVVFSSFYRLVYYSSQLVLYDMTSLEKAIAP